MKATRLIKRVLFVLLTVFLTAGLFLLVQQARRSLLLPTEGSEDFLPQASKMIHDRLQRNGQEPSHQRGQEAAPVMAVFLPEAAPQVPIIGPEPIPVFQPNQVWLYYLRPPPSLL